MPVEYRPSYEVVGEDEAATTQELLEILHSISTTVSQDEGHAFRSLHAKAHGIVRGTLEVLALPPVLAQGLFAQPARYPVVMRLSTTPGDLLEDAVSTPRGLAFKVMEVTGPRVEEGDALREQDFVMVNGPVFSASSARKLAGMLKMLATTTDKAPQAKKLLSAALRSMEAIVEKAGGESAALKTLGGHAPTHPLAETYFTQVPVLYGPYMAKFALVPVSASLADLHQDRLDVKAHPDALRQAIAQFFEKHSATWELRVQLCVDLERMPIEDASVPWPETLSPYIPVARIKAAPQTTWDAVHSPLQDNALAFDPWHALAAHRPIGSIMRVRRAAYAMSASYRQRFNASRSV